MATPSSPVRLLIVGAGNRGAQYARYAQHYPGAAQIVAVAEPRDFQREQLAALHNIPAANVVHDWRALAERPRFADGVIIATQDAMHTEPAIAFAERGYHLLLEKPMAPTADDCRQIVAAVQRNGVMLAVCHVMRYTRYTQALKRLVEAGRIGTVVSMQHLEPVGFWHQAHSFVRGNWRNEAQSSPMLLAKSCHDLDWIRYVIGRRCTQVSSFGSLRHFRADQRPPGAADRCLDCAIAEECPYAAPRFYLNRVRAGNTGWPVDVITNDRTEAGVLEAMRTGLYGRCVYACDNDVVDHQVVNLQFEDGATAAFTMTAFTRQRDRETHLFGTHGEIYGDGAHIRIDDFRTNTSETLDINLSADGSILSGHGGGDEGVMRSFVAALAQNDPRQILSGPEETLESHLMVFAAEQARNEGRVVLVE